MNEKKTRKERERELNNNVEHAQATHSLSSLVIDVNEKRTNTAEDWIVVVYT
jgi:hypothetical protein